MNEQAIDEGQRLALGQLVSLAHWIDDNLKVVNIGPMLKEQLAASCFDQTLEHQYAIASLIDNQLYGSAFALLRVMTESCIRGWWLLLCATDADAEYFKKNDGPPRGLSKLVDEIEGRAPGDNVFRKILVNQWAHLSSFTHTGYLQISQRFSGPILKPNYPVQMPLMAIAYTRNIGLLAAVALADMSGNGSLAEQFSQKVLGG